MQALTKHFKEVIKNSKILNFSALMVEMLLTLGFHLQYEYTKRPQGEEGIFYRENGKKNPHKYKKAYTLCRHQSMSLLAQVVILVPIFKEDLKAVGNFRQFNFDLAHLSIS